MFHLALAPVDKEGVTIGPPPCSPLRTSILSIRPRHAFTLIEMLVVVSITGVLMALLMSAVQTAREVARRGRCQNNLRQIGLALANYQGAVGVYPFGVGGAGPRGYTSRWSAQSQLLPYLEQSSLFHALNFSGVPWVGDKNFSAPNVSAIATEIELFLCPSDPDETGDPYDLGHNSYRACAGTRPYNLTGKNDGAFWYQSAVAPRAVRDGMSTTAMFSERCLGSVSRPDPKGDYYLSNPSDEACTGVDGMPMPRFPSPVELSGGRWADGNVFYTRYEHIVVPNKNSCLLGGNEDYVGPVVVTATSRHPGGVNVLFGDGSVRFVKGSIDLAVWRGLATIAGGELLGDGAY